MTHPFGSWGHVVSTSNTGTFSAGVSAAITRFTTRVLTLAAIAKASDALTPSHNFFFIVSPLTALTCRHPPVRGAGQSARPPQVAYPIPVCPRRLPNRLQRQLNDAVLVPLDLRYLPEWCGGRREVGTKRREIGVLRWSKVRPVQHVKKLRPELDVERL